MHYKTRWLKKFCNFWRIKKISVRTQDATLIIITNCWNVFKKFEWDDFQRYYIVSRLKTSPETNILVEPQILEYVCQIVRNESDGENDNSEGNNATIKIPDKEGINR